MIDWTDGVIVLAAILSAINNFKPAIGNVKDFLNVIKKKIGKHNS